MNGRIENESLWRVSTLLHKMVIQHPLLHEQCVEMCHGLDLYIDVSRQIEQDLAIPYA